MPWLPPGLSWISPGAAQPPELWPCYQLCSGAQPWVWGALPEQPTCGRERVGLLEKPLSLEVSMFTCPELSLPIWTAWHHLWRAIFLIHSADAVRGSEMYRAAIVVLCWRCGMLPGLESALGQFFAITCIDLMTYVHEVFSVCLNMECLTRKVKSWGISYPLKILIYSMYWRHISISYLHRSHAIIIFCRQ